MSDVINVKSRYYPIGGRPILFVLPFITTYAISAYHH